MASLQHDDAVRYLVRRRAGRAALLALALAAACGGDRNRPAGTDTTGAAAATHDSAPPPVTDTAAPAAADSGRSAADSSAAAPTPAARSRPRRRPPSGPRSAPTPPPSRRPRRRQSPPPRRRQSPPPHPRPPRTRAPLRSPSATQTAAAENAGTSLRDAYHQAPRDTVTQAVYDGWKQFNLNCARCHGEDVLGTTIAPHLIVSLKPDGPVNTKELFVQIVCAGRPEKGMPAWCALGLGMDKINEIYEYVKGRSDAKISPGRPAVKQQG